MRAGVLAVTMSLAIAPSGASGQEWVRCAPEGATCSFAGVKIVRYGASGRFHFGTFTDDVPCSSATFGDPIGGARKWCWTYRTASEAPEPVELEQLQRELRGRDQQVSELHAALEERRRRINELEAERTEAGRRINETETALSERGRRISELEAALEEAGRHINELQNRTDGGPSEENKRLRQEVATRDHRINELEEAIHRLETEVEWQRRLLRGRR